MKSRIPKSASTPDQHVESSVREDPSTIHATLDLLGAPLIELDEFNRLYNGPFGDTLLFISKYVKGRRQTASDRHRISQVRSQSGRPGELTRSMVEKSTSLLTSVIKTTEVYRKQLDDRLEAFEKSALQIEELKKKLEAKRQITLLLSVLEQKEKARMWRFKKMLKTMNDLKKSLLESKQHDVSKGNYPSNLQDIPLSRTSHVQNTLMSIHAYHIRLSRIASANPKSSSALVSYLQQILNIGDQDTRCIVDQYISHARLRSAKAMRYRNPHVHVLPPVSQLELDNTIQILRVKQDELQQLSDHSVALGFLCEHYITSIAAFLDQTSHILRSSLEEESSLAEGYIDTLRLFIATRSSENLGDVSFVLDVVEACKIQISSAQRYDLVTQAIQRLLQQSYRRVVFQQFPTRFQTLSLPSDENVASYQASSEAMEDQASKLLTRKVEKATLGDSFVMDIEALSREVLSVIG